MFFFKKRIWFGLWLACRPSSQVFRNRCPVAFSYSATDKLSMGRIFLLSQFSSHYEIMKFFSVPWKKIRKWSLLSRWYRLKEMTRRGKLIFNFCGGKSCQSMHSFVSWRVTPSRKKDCEINFNKRNGEKGAISTRKRKNREEVILSRFIYDICAQIYIQSIFRLPSRLENKPKQ